MDENNPSNQGPSDRFKKIEQELEELQSKAKEEYKNRKIPRPIAISLQQASTPTGIAAHPSKEGSSQTKVSESSATSQPETIVEKPRYIEESQIQQVPQVSSKPVSSGAGKSNMFFWAGVGVLTLALIAAGVYLLT